MFFILIQEIVNLEKYLIKKKKKIHYYLTVIKKFHQALLSYQQFKLDLDFYFIILVSQYYISLMFLFQNFKLIFVIFKKKIWIFFYIFYKNYFFYLITIKLTTGIVFFDILNFFILNSPFLSISEYYFFFLSELLLFMVLF